MRTDIFFHAPTQVDHRELANEAIERARAYAAAGADCIFVPGLTDEALIARVSEESPLPVNVMIGETSPTSRRLAAAGVARISYGPGPFLTAMRALQNAAVHAFAAL